MSDERRTNHTMRTLVNLAIVLAKSSTLNAAEFLRDHRVPLKIAVRVLLHKRGNTRNLVTERLMS